MNLPNLISLLRIAAVPLVVWLILENRVVAAFWVFFAAGVSDGVDGFIAKRFNMETELGKFLDPLADKALLVSVFVAAGIAGIIPSWLAILVVFRDVAIIGGALLVETLTHDLTMRPLYISKVNTVMQIVYAAGALGVAAYAPVIAGRLDTALEVAIALTAGTTIASGLAYAVFWVRLLDGTEEDEE